MLPKDLLKAIGDGVICPICNLGYIKVERVFTKRDHTERRIICDNCHRELRIVYQDRPFKIVDVKEIA